MQSIGFPAIANDDARILILGSLPGAESLARQEYYAWKSNLFWWIMGELVGASPDHAYAARLASLEQSGIALWDVCAAATRPGSLDSKILLSTVVPNDFETFLGGHPQIRLICFNGRTAEKLYLAKVLPGLPAVAAAIPRIGLPATSPAHAAMARDEKLRHWREAIKPVS